MSNRPSHSDRLQVADALHTAAIHLLRSARVSDRDTGLTPERLSLLSILVFGGAKTINQLATMEQVSAPAISRIVSSLQQEKLVIRSRSKEDARIVFVSATRQAQALMHEARKKRIASVAEQLKGLSDTQLTTLNELLGAIS